MTRRDLITLPALYAQPADRSSRFVKSICSVIFPQGTPYAECFRLARKAGFEAIEIRMEEKGEITPETTPEQARRIGDAARAERIKIASLWVLTPGAPSLASPETTERSRALKRLQAGIELAPPLGCGALLAIPGVTGRGARFQATHDEAWERGSAAFRDALPAAARAKVMLTPENGWSKFLVSPRDMREFIDQFRSPWVQAHFDVGNVMQFGYPQDWILTLGHRIRRVHVKDYKLSSGGAQGRFVPLFEGDVQWKEVMEALVKVGYRGYISPEISASPAEPDALQQASRNLDRILSLV